MISDSPEALQNMDAAQLRVLAASLMATLQDRDRELVHTSQVFVASQDLE